MAQRDTRDLRFEPGVVKDETARAAKPRWTDSDRIRFYRRLPQKLAGWMQAVLNDVFIGICRDMLGWLDNQQQLNIALGTTEKLQVLRGPDIVDITPFRRSVQLSNPFETTNGSAIVTVTDSSHGASEGDYVHFAGAAAVGGITVDGAYQIVEILTTNTYTILHSEAATSGAGPGGGTVDVDYEISLGNPDGLQGTGWGVGPYGDDAYGTPRETFVLLPPRTWSLDRLGQNLLAMPRGGSLYIWENNPSNRAALVADAPAGNIAFFVTEDEFIVVLGAGGDPLKIEWSHRSSQVFTPSATNLAGGRRVQGGNELLAGLPVRGTNLILSDAAAWTMTSIGGLDVFGFRQVTNTAGAGIIGPNAAVEIDGVGYWMGKADFFLFDGVVRPMPRTADIRDHVFTNLIKDQASKVFAVHISKWKEIWWFYPSAEAGGSLEISRYVKFNYEDRCWDVGTLTAAPSWVRTAMMDADINPFPLAAALDGHLFEHEKGTDADGEPMGEFIIASPVEIGDGHRHMDIETALPDFRDLTGTVEAALIARAYPMDEDSEETETFTVQPGTKTLDPRIAGRQVQLRLGGASLGSHWRFGSMRLLAKSSGER
jgi:hypothetical protein